MSLIRIDLSEPPVRRANGRGLDSDQDFVVLGSCLSNVPNLDDLQGPYLTGGFHQRRTIQAAPAWLCLLALGRLFRFLRRGGCTDFRLPEIRVSLDPFRWHIAHVRTEGKQ